ncbi:hypothetical protein RCL_jg26288.t1 [Rhizophagus clarus]|uniref:Uncharacterized protein n=1 Tax=Rhizophagus clarus TaxID=94130 RepID=A0A8H3KZ19_9GLOM|nr:hypothetical protein RCL_jg26288.t1 [Rhizophagus clarus]
MESDSNYFQIEDFSVEIIKQNLSEKGKEMETRYDLKGEQTRTRNVLDKNGKRRGKDNEAPKENSSISF